MIYNKLKNMNFATLQLPANIPGNHTTDKYLLNLTQHFCYSDGNHTYNLPCRIYWWKV